MQNSSCNDKSHLVVPTHPFQLKGAVPVTCSFPLESYVWYFTLTAGTVFPLLIGNHNHLCCSALLCFLYF